MAKNSALNIDVTPGGGFTYTFPSASGTLATLGNVETFSNKTLVTPILGVATGTSLALGGATIGANALAVTGTSLLTGAVTISGASFGLSGNISAPSWTTSGIRYKNVSATLTDTTSTGTVPTAYSNAWGGNTIAASSATTFTNYFGSYYSAGSAGTNVTITNSWALGADNIRIGTSNQLTVSAAGVLTAISPVFTTPSLGSASATSITITGTSPLNLGVASTTLGKIKLFGNTSGDVTIQPAAVAGTATVLTFPTTTGTLLHDQLAANSFKANKTASTATATNEAYVDAGKQTYSSTIAFVGTTAPSGATNHTYWWSKVGKKVTYHIELTYATPSTSVSQATFDFPSDMPVPDVGNGLTGASVFVFKSSTSFATTITAAPNNSSGGIRRDSGDTKFEFNITGTAGTYRVFITSGSYWTT